VGLDNDKGVGVELVEDASGPNGQEGIAFLNEHTNLLQSPSRRH